MPKTQPTKKYYESLKNRNDLTRLQTAFFGLSNAFQREVGVRKFTYTGMIGAVVLWIWLHDINLVEKVLFFTFLVTAFELINSSIETLSDYVQPEKSLAIKRTKDAAAAAVFIITAIAVLQITTDIAKILKWI